KIEIVNLNEDFIKSNAAQQWSEILLKIQNAFNANINIQEFEPYYIFTTLKEREKPIIKIDKVKLNEILEDDRLKKNNNISEIMEALVDDIKSVYVGYSVSFNY